MDRAERVLERVRNYAGVMGLNQRQLADKLGVAYPTVRHWLGKGSSYTKPSADHLERLEAFLASAEAAGEYERVNESKRRAAKIRCLLLLLEDELRWFRDGSELERDVFRKQVDANDVGYLASLLTMMSDEDRFRRWAALTTAHFEGFGVGLEE